jgi:hypothetical protein
MMLARAMTFALTVGSPGLIAGVDAIKRHPWTWGLDP